MSLRIRFTLVLLLVNVVVLGGLAWWAGTDETSRDLQAQSRVQNYAELLAERLSGHFGDLQNSGLREILAWPGWSDFEEALLVDNRVLEWDGKVVPVGAFLNPIGSRHRGPDFPLDQLTNAINQASRTLRPVTIAGGMALPLVVHERYSSGPREIWGGVFLRLKSAPLHLSVTEGVVLAAILATFISAAVTYIFLGRTVLRPVEQLASAAEDFGRGEKPQIYHDPKVPEIHGLFHSFGTMMERIQGFQSELESEVKLATNEAAKAQLRAARQERLAAMGTLAAGLAHEVNSPLAGALHGLETLRAEAHSSRAKQHGDLTAEALHRIQELVQRLLRLAPARLESGHCVLQQTMEDVQVFLAARLQTHPLMLEMSSPDLAVAAAPGDFFPVILNLVQNACDAMDSAAAQGNVTIRCKPIEGSQVEICIEDQGPGVSEDLLPHLFEPFVTTKDVGKGTGLGLALAYATVRQLGGNLEAKNMQPSGFVIQMRVPLSEEQ
ncbi:MAG: HAMP domain-containing histidine kinase [Planctomycetes bacterium]|nr:HAMP domain-containing histidine kinase [Planctomycetota bacterium]